MATDNYLEKYLPMKIQIMISQSIKSFINLVPNKFHMKENKDKFKDEHELVQIY
jgi:hypothetical protein